MRNLLIACFIGLFASINNSYGQDIVFDTLADLNSDGQTEKIILKSQEGATEFTLTISGHQKIKDKPYNYLPRKLEIIDIDESDKYKEVLVILTGYTDDDLPEYVIFWYDGTNIVELEGIVGGVCFLGNGIIYIDTCIDFWCIRDKYVLDTSTRKLILIPQYAYYVGFKTTVKKPFIIYREVEMIHKVALLGKDSNIELLLYYTDDKNSYFLIKSQTSLLGWTGVSEVYESIDESVFYTD